MAPIGRLGVLLLTTSALVLGDVIHRRHDLNSPHRRHHIHGRSPVSPRDDAVSPALSPSITDLDVNIALVTVTTVDVVTVTDVAVITQYVDQFGNIIDPSTIDPASITYGDAISVTASSGTSTALYFSNTTSAPSPNTTTTTTSDSPASDSSTSDLSTTDSSTSNSLTIDTTNLGSTLDSSTPARPSPSNPAPSPTTSSSPIDTPTSTPDATDGSSDPDASQTDPAAQTTSDASQDQTSPASDTPAPASPASASDASIGTDLSKPDSSSLTVSTAAPTASSCPPTKRGCIYNDASACPTLINASGIEAPFSFVANWDVVSGLDGLGDYFIPMVWGASHITSFEDNVNAAIGGGSRFVASFNEPDNSGQSNLSPAQAAALWYTTANLPADVKILSPAVTSQNPDESVPPVSTKWLKEFEAQISGQRMWDYTAVHYYGPCDSGFDMDYFTTFISDAYTSFGKPVYITECGCDDVPPTVDELVTLMNLILGKLDTNPQIAGYAVFMADYLLTDGQPNAAGQLYITPAASVVMPS